MPLRARVLVSFVAIALSSCASPPAQSVPPAPPDAAVLVDPTVPADLSGLAFLEGTWRGAHGAGHIEEHWTSIEGGSMLGMGRTIEGGVTRSFEHMVIGRDSRGGVSLLARPRGGEATAFSLVHLEGAHATFQNEHHDYPKRILYWRDADGALHFRIEGAPDDPAVEARLAPVSR
jgi:hypothetical protein